ncbi:hypothetical protein Patl1_12277 [Pistacia atlantica]|uniref:Uncharacterized protein n=1 Tax=Pistacia atlantica TaxID=434234 RepID=A0ACC1A6S6_9ROSI|nr:hypothetical protein Patl1_12277 [Pistacia atlantica]
MSTSFNQSARKIRRRVGIPRKLAPTIGISVDHRRKNRSLEGLQANVQRRDRAKGVDILVKDLKVFAAFNEELFKEITQLLTLENFRDNEQLWKYGDTKPARAKRCWSPSLVTNPLMGAVPKPGGFPPSAHGPFQPTPAVLSMSLAGWMANPSIVPHPSASEGPIG